MARAKKASRVTKAAPREPSASAPEIVLYVATDGDDRRDGRAASATRGQGGPFATVARAQREIRRLMTRGKLPAPVKVYLRGGVHVLKRPLTFLPRDSGSGPHTWWSEVLSPPHDVTYASYPGESAILSGGRRISGWRETEVAGQRAWVARLPQVRAGKWYFTQLWVNGRRARRTRLPREGLFTIAELPDAIWQDKPHSHAALFTGQDRFVFGEGDLKPWKNIRDVEFVGLHYWIESRINFDHIDADTRMARLQWKSRMRLSDDYTRSGAPYYVENVFEALDAPGQWYLDRREGLLYYLPCEGETIDTTEAYAPVLDHVLALRGDMISGKAVSHVHFRDLTFSHTEWTPADPTEKVTPQAACHVPGAVRLHHATDCTLSGCRIEHVGSYGLTLEDACRDVAITHCHITDVGAGGVKVWHTVDTAATTRPGGGKDMHSVGNCRRITIADCVISDGGHRYHQGVGVLIGKCSGVQIIHNHIHDFDYTGISVGWTWGYAEGDAYGNIIEHNHVHHIGRGVLSDMGGIYCLGVQPGTRIRYNVFHDVVSRGYGGWAIYTDEGSSHILIESNLAYRTKSQPFHQHYGRENVVRNNIFAFGGQAQIARSRVERHSSFTFERNIVLANNDDGKVLAGNWSQLNAIFANNIYFHLRDVPLDFAGDSFDQWRQRGQDKGSIVLDPGFKDPLGDDFQFRKTTSAARIGFVPWDITDVGPRSQTCDADDPDRKR